MNRYMIMIMIMTVFRDEAEKPVATPVHTYNNTQIKLSVLIKIITLNTLIMKYKSEVIKIIIYTAD